MTKDDEDIFIRTWFLPDNWWIKKTPRNLTEWHAILGCANASRWEMSDGWKKYPHIFLVNRPITFGHSQMVMPIPRDLSSIKESVCFENACIVIKKAIMGYENAFGKYGLHTDARFRDLAKRTLSFGRYEKTIIMRVSADENPKDAYKVHLVPYFESNAALCQERYCSVHKVSPDRKGGLIGWLGDRETEVDKWQSGNFELAKIARDTWKLPELAISLRKILEGKRGDKVTRLSV